MLSGLKRKKRCKKITIIDCPPNGKRKLRRLQVNKKFIRVKCPRPKVIVRSRKLVGQQLIQGLAGAIAEAGPQGVAGALGPPDLQEL